MISAKIWNTSSYAHAAFGPNSSAKKFRGKTKEEKSHSRETEGRMSVCWGRFL
jgi:hypothetical protein